MNNTFIIRCRGIILKNGKLLTVKHSKEASFYALPGGKLENNENPLDGFKREIKEELGFDVQHAELKYIFRWVDTEDSKTNIEFIFLVKDEVQLDEFNLANTSHAFEIFEVRWIDEETDIRIKPNFVLLDYIENKFQFEGVKFI